MAYLEDQIAVKDSGIHGKGIFTTVDIPRGKEIMLITGETIDGWECERREEEEDNVYIFWNGDEIYIDTAMTDKIKYINHDCNFNCDVVENNEDSLILTAWRDIKAGDELTIDYGYDEIYEDCTCSTCRQKK